VRGPKTLQVYDDVDAVGSIKNNTYRNIILPKSYGFETWSVTLTPPPLYDGHARPTT